jgi:hypothetical protein
VAPGGVVAVEPHPVPLPDGRRVDVVGPDVPVDHVQVPATVVATLAGEDHVPRAVVAAVRLSDDVGHLSLTVREVGRALGAPHVTRTAVRLEVCRLHTRLPLAARRPLAGVPGVATLASDACHPAHLAFRSEGEGEVPPTTHRLACPDGRRRGLGRNLVRTFVCTLLPRASTDRDTGDCDTVHRDTVHCKGKGDLS